MTWGNIRLWLVSLPPSFHWRNIRRCLRRVLAEERCRKTSRRKSPVMERVILQTIKGKRGAIGPLSPCVQYLYSGPKWDKVLENTGRLFFCSSVHLLVHFGQRPRRGRSPVEHRGTFVRPFVRASPPSSGPSGLKSGLWDLKSGLSGLKSSFSGLKSSFSRLVLGRDSVVRTEMGKQASCAKMYEHIVQYDKC